MKNFLKTVKNYLKKSDTFLLVVCLITSIYGLVLISSAVRSTGSNSSLYVQIGAIILGVFLYFIFSMIDVDIIAMHWRFLTIAGLLLILSLRWFGKEQSGNKAWLRFGSIGIQPAEFVKIIFIVTLGHLLTRFKEDDKLNHPLCVLAVLAVFAANFLLIVFISSDLGSALVYLFIMVIMLFTAGLSWYWILGGAAAVAVMLPYIWNSLAEYQQKRILAPYDPSIDPDGLEVLWQTNLSKMAIASGQITGQGLYHGTQTQAGYIPYQQTDFIFTVAGEELGMVGCIAVILLLTIIIVRCVQIGLRSQSRLGALVCIGIAAMLTFQTLENIGMCIGIAPVVGLTLPFFSYGGSSIVTNFAAMGIVSGIKMKPKPVMFI